MPTTSEADRPRPSKDRENGPSVPARASGPTGPAASPDVVPSGSRPGGLARRVVATPVGALTVVASADGVRAVLWPDDDPSRVPSAATDDEAPAPTDGEPGSDAARAHAAAAVDQLVAFFDGTRDRFDLALDLVGTPFQVAVWQALADVAPGETTTYGELAARLGRPTGARAVGAAIGRNPVSVVLPCHRVVGSDGRLTGFAGGLDAKRWLLRHEGARLV